MEKLEKKDCPECGQKLIPRCRTCHKKGHRCRNDYCAGDGEYICVECKKIYLKMNFQHDSF